MMLELPLLVCVQYLVPEASEILTRRHVSSSFPFVLEAEEYQVDCFLFITMPAILLYNH